MEKIPKVFYEANLFLLFFQKSTAGHLVFTITYLDDWLYVIAPIVYVHILKVGASWNFIFIWSSEWFIQTSLVWKYVYVVSNYAPWMVMRRDCCWSNTICFLLRLCGMRRRLVIGAATCYSPKTTEEWRRPDVTWLVQAGRNKEGGGEGHGGNRPPIFWQIRLYPIPTYRGLA